MSKFEIIRDQYDVILHPELEAQACEASEWTENDSKIPDGVEKYYLRANTGPKYLMGGVLSRPFITTKQNCGKFAITSIESSNAYSPTFLSNTFSLNKVHQVYSVLDGSIEVTVDGRPNQVLVGESVFIPAGTKMSILFKDRYVRFWAFTSGDGLEALISLGGGPFEGTVIPDKAGPVNTEAVLLAAKKLDITIHAA